MNKLLSIVNEELNRFVSKAKEFGDDDDVNKNNIDLQSEYDKYNASLFNGSLPKVPLIWKKRKNALGHVRSLIYYGMGGKIDVEYLAMSPFYAFTYRQFKNTLVHEMIHVLQNHQGRRGGHGYDFLREADRINRMGLGFNVTPKCDEPMEISDDFTNTKALIAFIINADGKYFVSVTTPNIYEREAYRVYEIFQHVINQHKYNKVEITVVETKNKELLRYGVSRSYKNRISYGALPDTLLQQLLEDKIIKNIIIERDKPMQVSESDARLNEEETARDSKEEIISKGDGWEVVDII